MTKTLALLLALLALPALANPYADKAQTRVLHGWVEPDGTRMAFVIALEKPIRQGNQKYSNLVLETHKVESDMSLNMTEAEIMQAKEEEDETSQENSSCTGILCSKTFIGDKDRDERNQLYVEKENRP